IKLYVTWRALQARRERPELFSAGDYLALESAGANEQHLFGFVRQTPGHAAIIAVPRLLARLTPDVTQLPLGASVWKDTRLLLPAMDPGLHWRNIFTD